MLELMRKHARNWLMKVILGIIVIVFIFYFGTMGGGRKAETIAIIDSNAIAIVDFQREYQNLIDIYRQRYGDTLTDDLLKELNLKQQALDNLIHQAIILHQASELKLEVTAEEVKASILSLPAFQKNGAFDDRIYRQILRSNKITPEEFEDRQKKVLTIAKVENLILDAVKISDQELYDLYRLQNEKININFLALSPKDFKEKVMPSQKVLETYLKVHGNDFRKPEQVQVKYISFSGQDFAPSVEIADTDVIDYYEHYKDEFLKTGGKAAPLAEVKDKIVAQLRKTRGMLIAEKEAKKAHDTIYQEENFAAYATQKKLKIATTGFFSLHNPPLEFSQLPDFANIAFGLQRDEISKVISDDRGYYIGKLTARKPSYMPILAEIEKEVERRYLDEESRRLCKQDSLAILNRLKKGGDSISRQKGLKVGETGFFLPGSKVPGLGFSQELNVALFGLSEKKPYPDKVFNVEGNFVIIQYKERGKLDNNDFEVKKEQLKNVLLEAKRNEYFQSWADANKASMLKEGKLKFTRDIKSL